VIVCLKALDFLRRFAYDGLEQPLLFQRGRALSSCQHARFGLYFRHSPKEACMIAVREMIRKKGDEVWSVSSDATVFEALKLMAEKNAGAVLVINDGKVAGILSERDCIRRLDLQGRASRETKVAEIMTTKVLYVESSQSLDECVAIMIDKNIRHLPVYEEGKLIGIISVRDALKEMVDYQKFMISQLEHYITGGGR
jgi:CBS domain-containing protein